jgi:hypothetical protein
MHSHGLPSRHQAEGLPSEQAAQSHSSYRRPLTCRFSAPGRIRTCTSRIRSKTAPVRLVMPWAIAAGHVRSGVQSVTSRQGL